MAFTDAGAVGEELEGAAGSGFIDAADLGDSGDGDGFGGVAEGGDDALFLRSEAGEEVAENELEGISSLLRFEIKLSQNRDGHGKPGVRLDLGSDRRIATQMRADVVGIQRKFVHGSMRSQPSSITRSNASASSFVMQPKEASKAACRSAEARWRI